MKILIDIPEEEYKHLAYADHFKLRSYIESGEVVEENALEQEPRDDIGEVSDGYHTFNQLYHQRAVLFATIVNQNKDKSWKSFKHSDGNYCFDSNGEWFIVGIDTPQGSYTYHYAKEYWDIFDCEELECGKEWDGHTEEDVTRLLSLEQEPCTDAISRAEVLSHAKKDWGNGHEQPFDYVEVDVIKQLPPVKPQYTDAEIQKMQDLEFAEIQKAYEIGKAENPNKWIPVSERYPEDGQHILFSTKTGCVFEGKYSADTSAHNWLSYKDDTYAWNNVVTAWMPLPEPYKDIPTGEEVEE